MSLTSLKIRNKLAIVVALLFVPVLLLAWLFIDQSFKDINFAKKESVGVAYLNGVGPVLRGMIGLRVNPDTASAVRDVPDLAVLGAAYDSDLDIGTTGQELRAALTKLGWPGRLAADDAQAEVAVTATRSLITKIADGSNLTLDPDLDSYYVMDAVTTKLPEAMEKIGTLTALARSSRSRTSLNDDEKAELLIQLGLFKAAVAGAAASLESAYKGNTAGSVRRSLENAGTSFARSAETFSNEAMAVTVALRDDGKRASIELAPLVARASEAITAADTLWRAAATELNTLLQQRTGGFQTRLVTMLGLSVIIVAIALVIVWIVARGITVPLFAMKGAMGALAAGDLDVVLPDKGRRDEIGEMTDMLHELKNGLVEAERLRLERRATEIKAEAEKQAAADRETAQQRAAEEKAAAERKAAMRKLADEFEKAVGNIVETVSSASTELESAAGTLTQTADVTQRLSSSVAAASEQASCNVQSVASATEEMTASVQEISRQVHESSKIAGEAVKQAQTTDARISELSHAAGRIGDVVKLITAVAEQTNLLALNATIEAARAGEAGKGFAVVAQEVKALAAQTAKATDEIGTQIAGMQTATKDSVAAIKEIGATIARISDISATVATAVEEQGAATHEIASNVQQAARGTAEVASNISDVNRGAAETGTASTQVLSSAQSLSSESSHLKVEVQKFLATVRAA